MVVIVQNYTHNRMQVLLWVYTSVLCLCPSVLCGTASVLHELAVVTDAPMAGLHD